jgi:nitroreductase
MKVVLHKAIGHEEEHYCIQDAAAVIQNIHLIAYSLGLGSCWIGAFKEEEVKQILKIPDGIRPAAIISVGYSAESLYTRGQPTSAASRSS